MYRIRNLRKKKGITMKELGRLVDLSESTISVYERGKHAPDLETLIRLADIFGVSVDYLLDRKEEKQLDVLPRDIQEITDILIKCSPREIARVRGYVDSVYEDKKNEREK